MVKPYYPVSVSTTKTILAVSNRKRTSLTVWNDDTVTSLYIGFDRQVSVFNGMVVLPQSGMTFLKGLGDRPDLELFGVTGGATIDVRILEATED
jgi:hypothetical protein